MNKGLIISIISGLSTLFGIIFTINTKKNKKIDKIVTISLSIAFIYMILVSLFDLFPNSLKNMQNKAFLDVFLYIMVNYTIIQIVLKITHKYTKNKVEKGKLYFLGLINMFTLLIHNIPEGISIAIPIYYSTKSKFKAFKMTFIAGISELFGAILSYLFLAKYINNLILGLMLIFTAGIMLGIAFLKLLPTCYATDKRNTNYALLIGIIFMLVSLLIDSLVF